MEAIDLQYFLTSKSEELHVEYKAWMDPCDSQNKAKLAKQIAALANHGGGYLIFGVDDSTKVPQGKTALARNLFAEDSISDIVKRYLDPRLQCRVQWVALDDAEYPFVIVPAHRERPVVAIADGPMGKDGKPVGVRQGAIYIRVAGPGSEAIRRPDDWTLLLERCLKNRADILASIMRQVMGNPDKPNSRVLDLLKAVTTATAVDFSQQAKELSPDVPAADQQRVKTVADNRAALAYAILGDDGELLALDRPRELNSRVSLKIRQHAYFGKGWSHFLPLTFPGREPQLRTGVLLDQEVLFLEGMRLPSLNIVTADFDYWRIYDSGLCCSVSSYHEDYNPGGGAVSAPYLSEVECLIKMHSILAHARLVGQEMPAISQIAVRMDWQGLRGRNLVGDGVGPMSVTKLASDSYTKTTIVRWSELRDDYFSALQRIAVPFFQMFSFEGRWQIDNWLTAQDVNRRLKTAGSTMRLFDQ